MVATPIASTTRYMNPGTTKVYFRATLANYASPTRSELDGAIDLSGEINAIDGFTTTGEDIETPDLSSDFTSKIPGRRSADDSSITFYADLSGADARALLTQGTNGNVITLPGGDTTGRKMSIFPIRVKSVGLPISAEGTDPATVEIQFSITRVPAENVTIP